VRTCPRVQHAAVLVYASDGRWTGARDVDLTAGPVTLGAFQPAATVAVTTSGLPAAMTAAAIDVVGLSASDPQPLGRAHLAAAEGSVAIAAFGEQLQATATYQLGDVAARVIQYQPRGPAIALDASGLPRLARLPALKGDTLAWEEAADGADPTLVYATVTWDHARLALAAPYTGRAVALPVLPRDLAPRDPVLVHLELQRVPDTRYVDALAWLDHAPFAALLR